MNKRLKKRVKVRRKTEELKAPEEPKKVRKKLKPRKKVQAKPKVEVVEETKEVPVSTRLSLRREHPTEELIDRLGAKASTLRKVLKKGGHQAKAILILHRKTGAPIQNCIVAVNDELRAIGKYPG